MNNQPLLEYGITQEKSDIRAHVSLPGRRVTVFRTSDMIALIQRRNYEERKAMQPCIEYETARGLLVPLEDINPQYVLMSEEYPWEQWYAYLKTCRNNELTTQKGRMAVNCVTNAIRMNKFPLWVCGHINNDREIDIQGTDIIVSASRRIQVKYDERAYPRIMGGSGNLFIQTHECNPMKNY